MNNHDDLYEKLASIEVAVKQLAENYPLIGYENRGARYEYLK